MDNLTLIKEAADADAKVAATRKFLEDLVDPEGFGYSVTSEVRREAMRLLELLK